MNRSKITLFCLIIILPLFLQMQFPQSLVSAGLPDAPRMAPQITSQTNSLATGGQQSLQPFGLAMFENRTGEFQLNGSYRLPPNYQLGPGDKIGVYILGENPSTFEATITIEGKLFIPSIGVIKVAGLQMEEFKKILNRKLSKFYGNYSFDIMLLIPKNIEIAVVGDVKQPGKYVLSSINTVLDAVLQAGGPSSKGSMRDIQLFRNGTYFASVDLYQFLMQAESQADISLVSGDRIFIPLQQSTITVLGEVQRPAIFELKPNANERLSDAIHFAGDFTELGYLPRVEISRLQPDGRRLLNYIDYREVLASDSCEANLKLRHGDQIRVYSKLEQLLQGDVSIYGNVKNPGEYAWQENMTITDLILQAGNLNRSAYVLQAELARIDPLKPARVIKIDLQNLLENPHSAEDLILEEDDKLFIREIPEWTIGPTIQLNGEVKFPGVYPIVKDSTWLSEVIEKAGGFTKDALIREAAVARKSSKIQIDKEYMRLKEMNRDQMSESEYQYFVMKRNMQDVGQVLVDFYQLFVMGEKSEDIILEEGDMIHIPKAPVVVQVTGRVSRPGGVLFKVDAGLKYYLTKAGGATWDADVKRTKVSKVTGEILKHREVKAYMPGDIIWVPRKPHRDWWAIFRDTVAVITQLATVYFIIDNIEKSK